MKIRLSSVPNSIALPLSFLMLPIGLTLMPVAPEIGIPLTLVATRFLGRKFTWARRFNSFIDRKWAKFRERQRGNSDNNRPRLWRWIVGTAAIFIAWQTLGILFTVGVAQYFGYDLQLLFSTDDADIAKVRELPAWSTGATVLISFVPLFLATLLAYRYLLRRPFKQLFTSGEKYSWRKTWIGFATLSAISVVMGLGDFIINNENYSWSWSAGAFLPYLLICLTLLPIQTTAEELFFRGWLQQWLDNGKKKQWTVSLASGFLFALPHLANPEVAGNELFLPIISYGSTGFMLAWVTYRDKGLELAIGAHFANNFLTGLLVSTEDSALPSVSLYTTPEVPWVSAAIFSVVMIPIFTWLTKKWSDRITK